jgi:hypothetical protein
MNPFIVNQDFHLKLISVYNKQITTDRGKIVETTEKYFIEEQKSVTVYKPGNNEVFSNLLFKLMSRNARDFYLYIIANIGENRDVISLDMKKIMELMSISKTTYYVAIKELKDLCLIADNKKSDYWINPYFLFRGDRISYYKTQCPDCVKLVAKIDTGDSMLSRTIDKN